MANTAQRLSRDSRFVLSRHNNDATLAVLGARAHSRLATLSGQQLNADHALQLLTGSDHRFNACVSASRTS